MPGPGDGMVTEVEFLQGCMEDIDLVSRILRIPLKNTAHIIKLIFI
jgi:hypothetical protein